MKKRQNRSLLWLEIFLLGASIGALTIWVASLVIPAAWEQWASWSFDQQKREQKEAGRGAPVNVWSTPRAVPSDALLGRLSIPRLNLTAMVREGDGESTLSLALGHIPGTALPGQHGNVGIAGHRDSLFRALRDIQKDDIIRVETAGGDYSYQVEETEIVQPEEVSVLKPGSRAELTLVTCYPFYYVGSAPERFIVKARAITSAPAPKPSARPENPQEPSL
ncbi:MAG TPA: class D sortase [Bryobacteraceae bacterium]|jgi:sortase A